jgi:ribosome-binding factor A
MIEKRRINRLSQQLRTEIAALVESALADPRIGTVTVTEVRLSADMRHARVYVSTLGDAKGRADTLAGLESARGFLRSQLSQRLPHLRRTPELTFGYDSSVEKGSRVEELIEEIHSSQQ